MRKSLEGMLSKIYRLAIHKPSTAYEPIKNKLVNELVKSYGYTKERAIQFIETNEREFLETMKKE